MVLVITQHDLPEPHTDFGHALMHPALKLSLDGNAQHLFGAEAHHKIVSIADDYYVTLCHLLAPDISPEIGSSSDGTPRMKERWHTLLICRGRSHDPRRPACSN